MQIDKLKFKVRMSCSISSGLPVLEKVFWKIWRNQLEVFAAGQGVIKIGYDRPRWQ